ncbi:MAG: hypothetical protein AMJ55_07175 [Gammaproteobacteria bacterium SG8_15]|nr:MAG: hypothetical protein AMJ55_07175 [Gammaproteobacteria bacterium SG8_15]
MFSFSDYYNYYVIKRDGSGLQPLIFAPQLDDQPVWSPTGERIVFHGYRTERGGNIWIMNAHGSNAINLTPDPLPGIWNERRLM